MIKLFALIVAGGSGKRMQTETPKQFLELAGKPVLMHTIERFKAFNDSIEMITVLPENQLEYWTSGLIKLEYIAQWLCKILQEKSKYLLNLAKLKTKKTIKLS